MEHTRLIRRRLNSSSSNIYTDIPKRRKPLYTRIHHYMRKKLKRKKEKADGISNINFVGSHGSVCSGKVSVFDIIEPENQSLISKQEHASLHSIENDDTDLKTVVVKQQETIIQLKAHNKLLKKRSQSHILKFNKNDQKSRQWQILSKLRKNSDSKSLSKKLEKQQKQILKLTSENDRLKKSKSSIINYYHIKAKYSNLGSVGTKQIVMGKTNSSGSEMSSSGKIVTSKSNSSTSSSDGSFIKQTQETSTSTCSWICHQSEFTSNKADTCLSPAQSDHSETAVKIPYPYDGEEMVDFRMWDNLIRFEDDQASFVDCHVDQINEAKEMHIGSKEDTVWDTLCNFDDYESDETKPRTIAAIVEEPSMEMETE